MVAHTIAGPAGTLHADNGGDGAGLPVLFVHSFAGDARQWEPQLAFLRRMRRAIAFDLRGHGQSSPPHNGDYAVASLATDIEAVADALALDEFIVVGHSMGGSAAIAFASANPERVAGLLLAGTPGKTSTAQSAAILAAMTADYDKVMERYWQQLLDGAQRETREEVRAASKGVPRDAAMQMIEATFGFDPVKAMRNYAGPCLVVNTPHADTPDALEKQVPDLPSQSIEGTSHWMQLDKPGEFNQILADFIDQVEAGAAAQPTWHTSEQGLDYQQEY